MRKLMRALAVMLPLMELISMLLALRGPANLPWLGLAEIVRLGFVLLASGVLLILSCRYSPITSSES